MKKLLNKIVVLVVFLTGGYQSLGHLWSVTGSANLESDWSGVARLEIRMNTSGSHTPVPVSNIQNTNDATPVTITPVPAQTPPAAPYPSPTKGTNSLTIERGVWKASFSTTVPVGTQQIEPSEKWRDRILRASGWRY